MKANESNMKARRPATLDIPHLDQLQSRKSLVGTCVIDEHDLEVLQRVGLMTSKITPLSINALVGGIGVSQSEHTIIFNVRLLPFATSRDAIAVRAYLWRCVGGVLYRWYLSLKAGSLL